MFASVIINPTCQWLAANNEQVDELTDASYYIEMRDMASVITPINHVWIWIHLINMFNFKVHIISPSHGMVGYIDPDGSVNGRISRLTVYFVVQKQKILCCPPGHLPCLGIPRSLRH